MTNRERLVLHPGSGSSSRVRRVRARRCIRFSLRARGLVLLAVILAAATPAPLLHGSKGRCARRPWTSESTIRLEHRWHKGALTAPIWGSGSVRTKNGGKAVVSLLTEWSQTTP